MKNKENLTDITESNFDATILGSEKPVVIGFWANWCDQCTSSAPPFCEVARELTGKVLFAKVDIDTNISLANKFGVLGIPTILTIYKGKVTATKIGAMTKAELIKFIEPSLIPPLAKAVI